MRPAESLPVRPDAQGIVGHSMGGHGARRCIALARALPLGVGVRAIANPSEVPWGGVRRLPRRRPRLARRLRRRALIESGKRASSEILVDQAGAGRLLHAQLGADRLRDVGAATGQQLQLREGYDHSYAFVASFNGRAHRLARRPSRSVGKRASSRRDLETASRLRAAPVRSHSAETGPTATPNRLRR